MLYLARGELGLDVPNHVVVEFKRDQDHAQLILVIITTLIDHLRMSNHAIMTPVQVECNFS